MSIPSKSIQFFESITCDPDSDMEVYRQALYSENTVIIRACGLAIEFDFKGSPAAHWEPLGKHPRFERLYADQDSQLLDELDLFGILPEREWLYGKPTPIPSIGVKRCDCVQIGGKYFSRRYLWIISEIQKHLDLDFEQSEHCLKFSAPGVRGVVVRMEP